MKSGALNSSAPSRTMAPMRMRHLAALALCACGARTELAAPEHEAGVDAATLDAHEERSCPMECVIGHECCAGSCSGPAVPTPSDCCSCLPGEVSSIDCPHDHCSQ